MYKLTIKFNNGTDETYKTKFTRDKIERTMISHCSFYMFSRHSSRIKKAKELLINDKFLDLDKDSVLTYFGATITSFEKIDGRTVEAKALDYFNVEEALKNF